MGVHKYIQTGYCKKDFEDPKCSFTYHTCVCKSMCELSSRQKMDKFWGTSTKLSLENFEREMSSEKKKDERNFIVFNFKFFHQTHNYEEHWETWMQSNDIVMEIPIHRINKSIKREVYHLVLSPQEQWALMGHNVSAPGPTSPT